MAVPVFTDRITVSGEWAKHLRPDGKRSFWRAERKAFGEHASRKAAVSRANYDAGPMPTKL